MKSTRLDTLPYIIGKTEMNCKDVCKTGLQSNGNLTASSPRTDILTANVTPSARFLYLALKEMGAASRATAISHEALGKLIGKCRRTVIRLCDMLEAGGFIC